MRHVSSLATILVAALAATSQAPAVAGDSNEPWLAPRARAKDAAASAPQSKPEDPTTAPAPPSPDPAAATPVAGAPSATAPTPPPAVPAPILPDASLMNTIGLVRKSAVGSEPNVNAYLDRMVAGKASAAMVNDFAAYIAKRGMPKVALAFQEYAVRLDPGNTTLWLNQGTIQRTTGAFGAAVTSYEKAITLDPINALAHYNLGAVYDAQGHYDDAIEEYRRAFVLDPGLADPRKNPQVVDNENLLAVELEIYRSHSGALGLPLLQVQKSAAAPKTPGNKP